MVAIIAWATWINLPVVPRLFWSPMCLIDSWNLANEGMRRIRR
jgi:hypothetical protein